MEGESNVIFKNSFEEPAAQFYSLLKCVWDQDGYNLTFS